MFTDEHQLTNFRQKYLFIFAMDIIFLFYTDLVAILLSAHATDIIMNIWSIKFYYCNTSMFFFISKSKSYVSDGNLTSYSSPDSSGKFPGGTSMREQEASEKVEKKAAAARQTAQI